MGRSLLAVMIGVASMSAALVGLAGTAGAASLVLTPGTGAYEAAGGANSFGLSALISGGTPSYSTLSITGQPSSGTATANTSGYITYTPGSATAGNQVVTYQVCTAPSTNCATGTVTFYPAYEENFGDEVDVDGIEEEDIVETLGIGIVAPTNPVAGTTITASIAPVPTTIPSSDSGATVNYASGVEAVFPIPAGLTYVPGSVGLSGGDASTTPQTTVTYCTAASTACTAHTTGDYHTTYPYLEEATNSSYHISPGTVTLPTATAKFTVTGSGGSTIKTTISEFALNINVTDSSFTVSVPFDGYPATCASDCTTVPTYEAQTLFSTTIQAAPVPPAITSFTPTSGSTAGGTTVTITGTNLSSATAVDFGANAATVTANTATSITATTPAGTAGAVNVSVTNAIGTGTASGQYTYVAPPPAPVISSISPATGPNAGGTSVTITGTNLANATAVDFGSTSTAVLADTATSISVNSPAGSGTVNVTVTTAGGTATSPSQYVYVAPPAQPVVSSFTPTSGVQNGGTAVTITGTGLNGATSVDFGGTPGTITADTATSLTVTTPAGTGSVSLVVTTPGGTATASSQYTYVAPPPLPVVSSISPTSGSTAGGTTVTITGSNLANASAVNFGSSAATITADSAGSITVTSPSGVGSVTVSVTTPGGTGQASGQFTYIVPAGFPVVTSVSPNSGPFSGGTTVTIAGTNLSYATGVSFGSQPAFFYGVSATAITAVAPAGSGGVDVTVTTPAGTSTANPSADEFTYTPPAPVISSVVPGTGPAAGGTSVVLTGSGLSGASAVDFGAVPGSIITNSPTAITVVSPPGTGTVAITVTVDGTVSAGSSFTYAATPVAVVTSVSPATGPWSGGTSVVVTGTNLWSTSGVEFGSQPAFFSDVTATSLTAIAPAGTGVVDVRITTPAGTSSANPPSDSFTYTAADPQVTSATPSSGSVAGGYPVTLAGTGLGGASAVDFGATQASVTSDTGTAITALAPAGTGTVQITVTVDGVVSNGTSFNYTAVPAPGITSVSPATGPAAGGTVVTITGTSLWSTSAVSFGSQTAYFTDVTATSVTATAPAGTGTVDITVTTPAGTSATGSSDQFTYQGTLGGSALPAVRSSSTGSSAAVQPEIVASAPATDTLPAPVVTAVSAPVPARQGRVEVTVTGDNLSWATQVEVGGVSVYFTNATATSVTVFLPAGSTVSSVSVVTPSGVGSLPATA